MRRVAFTTLLLPQRLAELGGKTAVTTVLFCVNGGNDEDLDEVCDKKSDFHLH